MNVPSKVKQISVNAKLSHSILNETKVNIISTTKSISNYLIQIDNLLMVYGYKPNSYLT